jgi:hypothetical protein
MRFFSVLVLLFATLSAGAQIGNYTFSANAASERTAPYTVVDLTAPSTGVGSIGAVAIRSNRPSCDEGFKLRFFRRSGNTLTSIAERGPFSLNGYHTTVQFSTPVEVQEADLIGVVALKSCMTVVGQTPVLSAQSVEFAGDVNSASITNGTLLHHFALAAYGAETSTSEIRTQVIVVAGAAAGANNAQFRTDVFLTTPRTGVSWGRLVYHREGTTGYDNDPSVPFTIEGGYSKTIQNIIGTSLGLSGKGSIDIYTRIGFDPPVVSARVYDEPGSGGTKGFSFDAQRITEALPPGQQSVLFTPQDTTKFRMNVGIRTLDAPSQIDFILLGPSGQQRAIVTKSYPPNYFTQPDANSLLGVAPQAGDTILIIPIDSPVYVYGSIIDNFTNDPSLQLAKPLQ